MNTVKLKNSNTTIEIEDTYSIGDHELLKTQIAADVLAIYPDENIEFLWGGETQFYCMETLDFELALEILAG